MKICTTINIKQGMPFASNAWEKFLSELCLCTTPLLKVIHGYGSSGKGGAIKKDLHTQLQILKKQKQIKDYLPGEQWNLFNTTSQQLIEKYPQIAKDEDLNRLNLGITIIVI